MQPNADTSQFGLRTFDNAKDSITPAPRSATPKDKLAASLQKSGVDAEGVKEFQNNLKKFEGNLAARNLPASTATETYRQLQRILSSGNLVVSLDLKSKFVRQWSSKLADPASVKQGWYGTSGMAFYETYALMNHPQAITKTLADVLTKGAATVPDDTRSRSGMVFFERTLLPKTTRPVKIDRSNLAPDTEAQGKSIHAGARDYADQVAQVTLNGLKWDMNEKTPDGLAIKGTMRFKQCAEVVRPSDSNDPSKRQDKSCDSVEEASLFGSKIVYDDNGNGFGGQSTAEDISRVHFALTGKHNLLALDGGRNAARSPEELETLIRNRSNLPLAVFVTPSANEFAKAYLQRHPDHKTVPPNAMLQIVGVNGFNKNGTIDVINPWGKRHALTAKQLHEAMQF